ncbi:MAG TPA: lectin-like protein [Polyangia bacterium]|nr:lectin-like protein [Polyangia bacterium]
MGPVSAAAAVSLLTVLAAGCLDQSFVFLCKSSDQCVSSGRTGVCEPTGRCSFSDSGCSSGRRYGRYAGAERSDKCTECGNAIVDPGEECDDGNGATDDACLPTCRWNICGDGFTRTKVEQCDDGNQVDGDGCSRTCLRCATGDATFVWPDNGHCYTRSDTPRSWDDSHRACSESGGYLVTYNSEVEQLAVRPKLLAGTTTSRWIGLRDIDGTGYTWVTGEPVVSPMRDFTSPGPPSLCANNQSATGAWNYLACDALRGSICEESGWAIDPKTHHAYHAFFNQPSWTVARDTCPRWGGHLVTITDRDEHEFISAQFFGTFWLGAMKTAPDVAAQWAWINGDPFAFQAFADGEPDDKGSACLALGPDRRWHDRVCDGSWKGPYGFICEVE